MTNKFKQLIKTVEKSGQLIKSYYGQNVMTGVKSSAIDFVTKADLASEANILKFIRKNFSTYNILSEEEGLTDNKSEYTFVLDPLDGTINFHKNLCFFAVTLALLKGDEAIFAVTHNPLNGQTYYAFKNKGAYLNGKRIYVSKTSKLNQAMVGSSWAWRTPKKVARKMMVKMLNSGMTRLLNTWSPAWEFCLLASGQIDAHVNYDNDLYDNLAGKLLIREAGGKITGFDGRPLKNDRVNSFIASNNTVLHKQVLNIFKK
ncbi:MAG: inositol monophosphatase [Candidatus Komeilibacteria bacterium]|nr:inositol monophosphatase [Candidatus Komeilibacteria bacterium]